MEQSKFYQIKNVTECEYTLVGCDGSVITRPIQEVDKIASAFTIQDAKDGDVLVSESACGLGAWYCIFKSLDGDESMTVYCYLARDGRFETKKELCFDKDPYNTNPATKEQREQLEKAMADAGYTFDFENKKLKKIEQNPAENKGMNLVEEEMTPFQKKVFCIIDTSIEEEQGLKQVCDELLRLAHNEIMIKQKSFAWSDEDERHLNSIINRTVAYGDSSIYGLIKDDIDWLKSLRPQTTWEPSEEQMKALKHASNDCSIAFADMKILATLYEQLKALHHYEQDT